MTVTIYRPARAARLAAVKAHVRRVRRLLSAAVARFLNGPQITEALNTGRLVTVSNHMTGLGADSDQVRRYSSPAGKKVKAAFLGLYGIEPGKVWVVRNGRPVHVYAYSPTDPALTDGLAGYARTAHLVRA